MLHTVAQLSEDGLGDVCGALGDEVDAHSLASDESDDLLDLIHHGFGGVLEEHVRLVEEEDEFWFVKVAHLGKGGVEVRHQPEQECGVEFGLHHQFVGCQDVHDALAAFGLEQVHDVERRFAEELVGALSLELQQRALDGADGC